jgi:uncharacterized cupin superfamily protein
MQTSKPTKPASPEAIRAADAAPKKKQTNYPEPYASRVAGREKRPLGDVFGLSNFGVNLTRLKPGAVSSVRHAHTRQDEFVYVLEGHPTLVTDAGETPLAPGMCAGFRAGTGNGHHLVNRGAADAVYLEVGDRTPGDSASYPDDDLVAAQAPGGGWVFTRKDGSPFQEK